MIKSYKDLYNIKAGIESFKDIKMAPKFAICLSRNKSTIVNILKPIEETFKQLSDEDKAIFKEMMEERDKYKDSELTDQEVFIIINEKYSEILEKTKELEKENLLILDETCEIDLHTVSEDFIPDLTLAQIDLIQDMVI